MKSFILKKSGIDALISTLLVGTMFEDVFTALTPFIIVLFVLVGNLVIYMAWLFIKVLLIKFARKLPEPYSTDIIKKIDKVHGKMTSTYARKEIKEEIIYPEDGKESNDSENQ